MTRLHWMPTLAILLAAGTALATGMKLEPGQWEFRSTTQTTMSPTPQTEVTTECVGNEEMSPEKFLAGTPGCSVTDAKATASGMSWNMSCTTPGGAMTGKAEFTSQGDSLEGVMTMSMQLGDQQFEIENRWSGRRLGPCD